MKRVKISSSALLFQGSQLATLRQLRRSSVDSVVTFPTCAGSVKLWKRVLRAVKPGGYCLAGATPIRYNRMACALEDAGWLIKDCIIAFFSPIAGAHPPLQAEVAQVLVAVAQKPMRGTYARNALKHGVAGLNIDGCRVGTDAVFIRGGGAKYDEAGNKTFHPSGEVNSWRSGRWPANVVFAHSSLCTYVGTDMVKSIRKVSPKHGGFQKKMVGGKVKYPLPEDKQNRFVDADGNEPVARWLCHPSCVVAALDQQSGDTISPSTYVSKSDNKKQTKYGTGTMFSNIGDPDGKESIHYGDVGGASRFFQIIDKADYDLARFLCRLSGPPGGGTVLDPFATPTTASAAFNEHRTYVGVVKTDIALKRLRKCISKLVENTP